MKERAGQLKEEVREIIKGTNELPKILDLIVTLQRLGLDNHYEIDTTENSNTSVGVAFFCVCFSIHTEKFVIFLCVSKILTKIFENPQKNYVISLCMSIHTEKLTLLYRFIENAQKKYIHAHENSTG